MDSKRMTWQDRNGGEHYRHTIRSNRNGGFMVIDVLHNNVVIEHAGRTREEAWRALNVYEQGNPRDDR